MDVADASLQPILVLFAAALLLAGPRAMRTWFGLVARRKSTEICVLNVLTVILAMACLTGLSVALCKLLEPGDVVVLPGEPDLLAAAEIQLLQG